MSEEKIMRSISIAAFIAGILTCLLLMPNRAITVHGSYKIDSSRDNYTALTIPISVIRGGSPFLRIKSTSCIFKISVNNIPITNPTIPYCDSHRGRVFRIDQLTFPGEFSLQLEIQRDKNQKTSVIEELPAWSIFTASFLILTSFIFGLLSFKGWERLLTLFTRPEIRASYQGILIAGGIILVLWLTNFYLYGTPSTTAFIITCALSIYLFYLILLKRRADHSPIIVETEKNIAARGMLLLFGVSTFILLSAISIIRHKDLRSLAFDLAIKENVLWNTLHGDPFLSSVLEGINYFGIHTVFASVLLLPFYFLFQVTETLLILQAGIVCSTILPLFLIARRLLKSEAFAAILSLCFLLQPGILGASCNDFHEVSLAPPGLMWITYCALLDKRLALACLTLVTSSIKEDSSINLLLLGFGFFVLNLRSKGIYLMFCGALSYITWQIIIIPTFAGLNSTYVWYFSKMIGNFDSPSSVLSLVLESPFNIVVPLFDEERLKFFLQTIGAFVFLPWCSLFGVIVTSYGNALVLFSGHWPLYTLGYHYVFAWITLMTLATLFFLSSFRSKVTQGSALSIIVIAHSWIFINYGPLFPREAFYIGPSRLKNPFTFLTDERVRSEFNLVRKNIPDDASVLTEERLVPHFSQRKRILTLDRAPKQLIPTFDYCIVERKTPDLSCDDLGCPGKEISEKNSTILVCSRV